MWIAVVACIGFTAAGQTSPSGPKAMPENVHQPKRYDHMTAEPRRSTERPQGALQYDLDSAYLPDVVGGYVEIVVGSDSSTITAESEEVLREIATLLKERSEIGVWVTAQLETDASRELRDTLISVETVVEKLRRMGVERVPFRSWRPEEKRPETPLDVLEIRVSSSANRPIS